MWRGALEKLKGARAVEGHTLRVSYDDLDDWEKSVFLDFACILCDNMGDMYTSPSQSPHCTSFCKNICKR